MRATLTLLTALLLAIAGCNRDEQAIRTYQVPKEPEPTTAPAMPMPAMAMTAAPDHPAPGGGKEIDWTVPSGWKELPGQQMRFASFQVSPDKPDVQLTVIPLGGEAGDLLANVNRWENQLGLPPTPQQDLKKVVQFVDVNGTQAASVDLTGPEKANPRMRMLGAIVPHEGRVWFFKLVGPADVVGPQKENFDAFIKSLKFASGGAAAAEGPEQNVKPITPPDHATQQLPAGHPQLPAGHPQLPGQRDQQQLPAGHPQLPGQMPAQYQAEVNETRITSDVPQGWTQEEPKPFRVVSFQIGEGEKSAEVIVSKLPATGSGSYQDNVNRWRNQAGLPPLKEGEPQPSQPIKVGGVDGTMFDFVGQGPAAQARHMVVVWVPQGTDWWFFKLTGSDDVVSKQQQNFEAFIKSVKFVQPSNGAGDNRVEKQ